MHILQFFLILAVEHLQMTDTRTVTDVSLNCTSPAEKCPLTYEDWQNRAQEYNCTSRQYTCIMDMNKDFVEACTWEYKMRTGTLRASFYLLSEFVCHSTCIFKSNLISLCLKCHCFKFGV